MQPRTVIPEPSAETRWEGAGWASGSSWVQQNSDINAAMASLRPRVLFLGDSLTQGWGGPGRNLWEPAGETVARREFASTKWLNGGIAGDSLQNIHWRVRNGLFDVHQPELIVVLAGTNNVGVDSTPAVLDGLRTIVEQIHERSSSSKVLILKLLPRGDRPAAAQQIQEINDRLTDLKLPVVDAYSPLAREGKADPSAYQPDGVHLNAIGYARLAEVLREPLRPYQAP